MIETSEYFDVTTSSDDNDSSIHFIENDHDYEYIEEEIQQEDSIDDDNTENYYTIEIEDDYETDTVQIEEKNDEGNENSNSSMSNSSNCCDLITELL